jgi:hypothetical protein
MQRELMRNAHAEIYKTAMSAKKGDRKINHSSNISSRIVSSEILEEAFEHVSAARKDNHHNSDIWHVRANWKEYKEKIRTQILSGTYRLDLVNVYKDSEGEIYSRWSSKDAIVLKAISIVIDREVIEKTGQVYHLRGEGGLKGAVRNIGKKVNRYKYVVKSDVADFYRSMDHGVLLGHSKEIIKDKRIIEILKQYMSRLEFWNSEYRHITRSIYGGCPLLRLIGLIILKSLDKVFNKRYGYARYMDDWVILTESKRFGFLGYRIGSQGIIGLARKTIDNFFNKTAKLYEQGASLERISCYITKWCIWVKSGVAP